MATLDLGPDNGVQGTSYLYDFGTSPNTRTAVSQKVRILAPAYGSEEAALHQMGVVSSFNPSQSRTVEPVRGIGFGDQIAELVPSVTEPTTGSFERALLYLCNLWQATGYAAGVDGPVRSLRHHKWPFDLEQQLVFSVLADADLSVPNQGIGATGAVTTDFQSGTKAITFPQVTQDNAGYPTDRGESAIITIYEACWFTSWSATFAKDAGMIMETGDVSVSDVHDFSTFYGEFLATGNDPTIGQLGSIRFAEQGDVIAQAGRGATGGGTQSIFVSGVQNPTAT